MSRKRETELEVPPFYFEPRTKNQALAIEVIQKYDLTFLYGPAGSSKSHTAVAGALKEFFVDRRRVQKIIITRPIVESGEKLGALPGDIKDKVHPHMRPLYDCAAKMINNSTKFMDEFFEISPLAYMRGYTFENCVAILDEAQNCTVEQLLLFMTRLGVNGKMIIAGDISQADIGRRSGLAPWIKSLYGKRNIGFVEFTEDDIVRHPLVKTIIMNRPLNNAY